MSKQGLKTALILGDLIGQPGCRAIFLHLKKLIRDHKADVVIVNGENAADGFGLTPELALQIFEAGAMVITTGNHIWQKDSIFPMLKEDPRILRPGNYSSLLPGTGLTVQQGKDGLSFAVMNLQGRRHMAETDDPFTKAEEYLRKIPGNVKTIFLDFHAEAPEEKEAMGHFLAGKVTAVVGTHTHIQTADEKILADHTAYLTDMGMCGAQNSVIGSEPGRSIEKALTQLPHRAEVLDAPADINGVVLTFDPETGAAHSINRLHIPGTL
jgi:metallophosphoesterase (TIGR00282 family)